MYKWYGTPVEINVETKVYYNQNTLTGKEISNFTYLTKNIFRKEKILKDAADSNS